MGGFMEIVQVVSAVASVVSIGLSVTSAADQKDQAKQQEQARKDQLALEAQRRELQEKQQRALLERQARAKRASIINNAASSNVQYTSSFDSALEASRSNLAREMQFVDATSNLAEQSDQNTLRQIALDSSRQQSAALYSGLFGAMKGIGSFASTLPGAISAVNSMTTPTQPVDYNSEGIVGN
jgi:hypothetical protein